MFVFGILENIKLMMRRQGDSEFSMERCYGEMKRVLWKSDLFFLPKKNLYWLVVFDEFLRNLFNAMVELYDLAR